MIFYEMVSNLIKYVFFILFDWFVCEEYVEWVKYYMKMCIDFCIEFDEDDSVYFKKYYFGFIKFVLLDFNCCMKVVWL